MKNYTTFLFVYLASSMSCAYATSFDINLHGNLINSPPDCIVNNNQSEVVHFGDILLTRINGENYKRSVPLKLSCNHLLKNSLKMTLQGDTTSFEYNGALKTSNEKLGIIFFVGDKRKAINQPIMIDYNSLPKLEAAPIKNDKANYSEIDGGYFTASSTLKIEYQ